MKTGRHFQLTPQEIDQAIRLRAYEVAKSRGEDVPDDLLDFLNRSTTHMRLNGVLVPLQEGDTLTVMVTFDGG